MARDILSDESSDSDSGGAEISATELKVNQDFAKRFEHNKKREELQRLEEKVGSKASKKRKRDQDGARSLSPSDAESSSSSEDEDEDAEFATEALDTEIADMINAIKSKDPRIYDPQSKFLTQVDEAAEPTRSKPDKALYLKDYHRQNLLNGANSQSEDNLPQPLSYNQEQDALRASVVGAMHAAAEQDSSDASSADDDDDDDDDDSDNDEQFFKRKAKQEHANINPAQIDPKHAEKDPETFLSNFMASRAWLPTDKSTYTHAFESDDSDDEQKAEEFEQAYNMRFEDPLKSNETLRSHARDMAAKYSVRRDEMNPRQKRREAEKAKKEAEKVQAKEDRARLKKLRLEEIEDKVKRIKRAGGLRSGDLQPQDWSHLLNDDWDDDQWEQEMQKRFNDQYYAEDDLASADDLEVEQGENPKKKPKKPTFDDDIDINDIIPDFDAQQDMHFSLSEEEEEDQPTRPTKPSKRTNQDPQKSAKKERRIISQLVDSQLALDLPNPAQAATFRYRETSPNSFGLTARDILLAEDAQLNEFVGLKKLAAWRDPEKKERDRKRLGKRARLRRWRLDTFGDEEGAEGVELVPAESGGVKIASGGGGRDGDGDSEKEGGVDVREGERKKRRRRKKQKTGAVNAV